MNYKCTTAVDKRVSVATWALFTERPSWVQLGSNLNARKRKSEFNIHDGRGPWGPLQRSGAASFTYRFLRVEGHLVDGASVTG